VRRDQWVADFAHALVELRPHLTFRFAMVIGLARYGQNQKLSPEEAAKLYAAEAEG
jgi:hypothetical protein